MSKKSRELQALEQQLTIRFRKFQDCQNSMYRASQENNIPDLQKLARDKAILADQTIKIITDSNNEILRQISESTRNRIIAILHQSDSSPQYTPLHEKFLYSLTNKIAEAEFADWAIEYDLTCVQKQEPQRYGTLVNPDFSLEMPIAGLCSELTNQDYKILNARRKTVGIPLYYPPLE